MFDALQHLWLLVDVLCVLHALKKKKKSGITEHVYLGQLQYVSDHIVVACDESCESHHRRMVAGWYVIGWNAETDFHLTVRFSLKL